MSHLVQLEKSTRFGFIGTGVMGRWMCEHLMNAGYKNMTVFNRTKEKAQPLLSLGALWASTPEQVAKQSSIVFTIVSYPHDVEEIYLGQNGILKELKEGSIVIDMTTSKPELAQRIANEAKKKGIWSLDAPVSGGDVGARNAALSFMVGGEKEAFDHIMPLFQIMGKNINLLGGAGCGQHTKMVNQVLISTLMIGMCEALLYGHKAGLDLENVLKAVSSGAAGSWSLSNLGPRILKRNFDPGFMVDHFVKDLEIALDESRRMNLCLPGLALAHQLYVSLKAQGHGKLGTHSLQLALENLNNIKIEK